jgi:hypothetical protein
MLRELLNPERVELVIRSGDASAAVEDDGGVQSARAVFAIDGRDDVRAVFLGELGEGGDGRAVERLRGGVGLPVKRLGQGDQVDPARALLVDARGDLVERRPGLEGDTHGPDRTAGRCRAGRLVLHGSLCGFESPGSP